MQKSFSKPLADRAPLNVAAASRLALRVKQARPGRQPTAASLTLACWNVRRRLRHLLPEVSLS